VILLGAALQVAAGIAIAFQPILEVHCALKCLIGLSACIMFSAAFQISRSHISLQFTDRKLCLKIFSIDIISRKA
jgi:hypothetical protein